MRVAVFTWPATLNDITRGNAGPFSGSEMEACE